MKIAAYIPIKLNNTRLPGKNLKKLSDGKPMCSLLFDTLSKVNGVEEKYCFCSSEEVICYLPPNIQYLRRSEILDTRETKCNDIIRSFIDIVNPDVIILTHVTSPFVTAKSIEESLHKVLSGEFDSAMSVERVQEFFWCDGKPLNFDASLTPSSQDLPIYYKETNGFFIFTKEIFEKYGRRVGFNPYLYITKFPEALDINYPEDFEIVDAVYTKFYKR